MKNQDFKVSLEMLELSFEILDETALSTINGGSLWSSITNCFKPGVKVTPTEPAPTYSLINGRIVRTGEVLIVST